MVLKLSTSDNPKSMGGGGKAAKQKPLIAIPVLFGGIVIALKGSLAIEIAKGDLTLKQACDFLHDKRLIGSIVARPEGAGSTQTGLFGVEGDTIVEAEFGCEDIKGDKRGLSAKLLFAPEAIDLEKLDEFPGRFGLLIVDGFQSL